jgi:hypothetical protein
MVDDDNDTGSSISRKLELALPKNGKFLGKAYKGMVVVGLLVPANKYSVVDGGDNLKHQQQPIWVQLTHDTIQSMAFDRSRQYRGHWILRKEKKRRGTTNNNRSPIYWLQQPAHPELHLDTRIVTAVLGNLLDFCFNEDLVCACVCVQRERLLRYKCAAHSFS